MNKLLMVFVVCCVLFSSSIVCVPVSSKPLAFKQTQKQTKYQTKVAPALIKAALFIGGWLAGEIVGGVFKGVTGKTPADITASVVSKAKKDAIKKWRVLTSKSKIKVSFKYDRKTGKYLGCTGCAFGGGGGGSW